MCIMGRNAQYAHYISRLLHPFISNGIHIHIGCSKIMTEKRRVKDNN